MNDDSYLSVNACVTTGLDHAALTHVTSANTSLADRFQGALLGLTLVPVVLGSLPAVTDASTQKMTDVIQACLSPKTRPHPWLSQLPVLLRYYDEAPHHRHQRLAAGADSCDAIAYQCFLSDVVSRALSGLPLTLGWLQTQQQRVALQAAKSAAMPPKSHALYTSLWNDVVQLTTQKMPIQSQIADFHAIIVGAAGIITCASAHYSVCVPFAALSVQPATPVTQPVDHLSFTAASLNWEASLVAALLSGAIGGRRSLPVLWQRSLIQSPRQSPSQRESLLPEDAMTLANQLFDDWSGRQVPS